MKNWIRLKSKLIVTIVALSLFAATLGTTGSITVAASSIQVPLALVFYGWHDSSTDQRIINVLPEILIDNTPGGLWHGNCNSKVFQDKGIKVFSYIDASYGSYSLATNYTLIDAIAKEGTYGVFIDETSPSATTYNTQLCSYAHSKGLKVILNPGMPSINANMYSIADYVMTDEQYRGRNPSSIEASHLNQTIVIGFGNTTAQQAADFTNTAWAKGFAYAWQEQSEYTSLPSWLENYSSLLSPPGTPSPVPLPVPIPNPTPTPQPVLSSGAVYGTVANAPVPSGGKNEYVLYVKINSTTVSGLVAGQQVWVAASIVDFPNLLKVGSVISATLDKSTGWWVMKPVTLPTTTNNPPVLARIGAKSVTAGQTLVVTLNATDPDGDALVFSSSGIPAGAVQTGTLFSWTPLQTGNYSVTFIVSDGKSSDSESININVSSSTPIPPPPILKGNTTGVVISAGLPSGSKNEYNFSLRITTTSVSGVSVGQIIWLAAKTTDFPSLITVGSTLNGNLDKSLGWWMLKVA